MAVDKNNFCWISFPNGIQKFDGNHFTSVEIQAGLPDDKTVYFLRCSAGDLFISHSFGISKYEITSNRFKQIYSLPEGEKKPPFFLGEDENIIYFYIKTGYITGMDKRTSKILSKVKLNLPIGSDDVRRSDNIINHKIVLLINNSLYLWDLKKRRLVGKSPAIPNPSLFTLKLKSEDEVLYVEYKVTDALQVYNFRTGLNRQIVVEGKSDQILSRCIMLPWNDKTLISFTNKLYETDSTLQILKSELVDFQNRPISGPASIARIVEDNFGNLIIATVNSGIKKVFRNNYPIKYYGTDKTENKFILSILPDKKNNRILTGTAGNGLLIFDTLQQLVKHVRSMPGQTSPFWLNTILKTDNGNHFLFNVGEKDVWKINKDFSEMKRLPISSSLPENRRGVHYFGNKLFQNEREAIIQSQGLLYRINFAANSIQEHEFTVSYTLSGLHYNNIIVTHTNDELIFLNSTTFQEIKRIPFKNTGGVRCFARDAGNNIYVGSNKGVFKIDMAGKILHQITKADGLFDECIYAMVIDNDGFLWCSTNKGIFRVNKDNSILHLTKEDGLQENEFNTNVVAKAEDGEIFFGGINGISSFYPSGINTFEEKINLIFTDIKVNNAAALQDTAAWAIDKLDLRHNQNSVSFDFIAMADANPGQYTYQYKMKGIDDQWIQNKGMQTVRYYLSPGKYVFQIAASRHFNNKTAPMKEIRIVVHPPFWKTWWFISALILVSLLLLTFIINRYNHRKYQKKLELLAGETKIRQERERISRDLHDTIGAYANTVLYKSELLQDEDDISQRTELIKDLQFNSKDIITSLRETIWALKKETFTADDCFLRITNFVTPFNRYYPHIKFAIEGRAPANKIFHHNKALHLVRIVQEAITNSLKHAAARNIIIQSSVADTDWKLTISDDGKGFDYPVIKKMQLGNGLNNMEQRASDAGIILAIDSAKHTGTTITILC